MKELINTIYNKFQTLIKYLGVSIASTVLDTIVVWILFHVLHMELTAANTCGVVSGFILGFVLSDRFVFQSDKKVLSFLIWFGTFLIGLAAANYVIDTSYNMAIAYFSELFSFLLSKGLSIVIPFFLMYYLRKFLYALINKGRK